MTDTPDIRDVLQELSIAELRQKATKNFGLKLTRDHTKEDIINLIAEASRKNNYAMASEGDLKPGWARIKIHRRPEAPTQDMMPFNINNYQGFIPIGIEVDVPIKVLEVLDHAEEMKLTKADQYGNPVFAMEASYPYTLISKIDGPDPRPGFEVQRAMKIAGKQKFKDQKGFWPTDKVYAEYMARSAIFNPYSED